MIDGRRGETLAAALAPRVRRALWWLAGGMTALFVANWALGVLSIVVAAIIGIVWLALVAEGAMAAWDRRAAGMPALLLAAPALFALPTALMLANPVFYWSHVAPSWVLLMRHRAAFDAVVSGTSGSVPGVAAIETARGRTAFLTQNGMLGAWRGIVHDPSGRMAFARGWSGGLVARDVAHIFGSRTVWCQRLDGPYFHCHFD